MAVRQVNSRRAVGLSQQLISTRWFMDVDQNSNRTKIPDHYFGIHLCSIT